MDFKYAKLTANPTVDEIDKEIARLTQEQTNEANKDSALKIILNSIYGVVGYPGFICYNKDVAFSITNQSQSLIKYITVVFNNYFLNEWHLDKELHDHLGINDVEKCDYDVIFYADTDSAFVVLDKIYSEYSFKYTFTEFAEKILKFRIDAYVAKKLEEYVDGFYGHKLKVNGRPSFLLALDQMCHSVLWTSKKKYIKEIAWSKGTIFKPLTKVEVKGLEMNTSAVPKFVRERLEEVTKYIVASGGEPNKNELLRRFREVRRDFGRAKIEDISKIERVSNYEEYVLNDTTAIECAKGAKPHVKGAGYHNYVIRQDEETRLKFNPIRSGQKVHWYYTKSKHSFSFLNGEYPEKVAPKISVDIQFEILYLGPVNNIVKVIGLEPFTYESLLKPVLEID